MKRIYVYICFFFITVVSASPSSACKNINSSNDPDVKRNRTQLIKAGVCYTVHEIHGKHSKWLFQTFASKKSPNRFHLYLPHDNEQTAFDAAVYAITKYGGSFTAVHTGENRYNRRFDPNRHFGLRRGNMSNCPQIQTPAPIYTNFIQDKFAGKRAIITLHNNTNGGSVSMNGTNSKNIAYYSSNPMFRDPDNFIYVAGTVRLNNDPTLQQVVRSLNHLGLNVMHELVNPYNNDCSFSNYIALNKLGIYINIEAQHNHLDTQKSMVDLVLRALNIVK